ncbi:MAG TPA: cysteine--tRNA ligase [Candidatus Thermoplasmatota archaeon]|nr:cysteine--tRNA ligase [Candidatus Thermoplasmatota archaeon]
MVLRIHNVRTRQKEPFAPLDPKGRTVGMYVCGLTVYDHAHIGHARTAVAFEVVRRWLERSYPLTYVQNVTDVDDKILDRAKELGVSPREHAAHWDRVSQQAMARLGVRPPDEAPHVTTSIPDIVRFIGAIVERGFAYATPGGSVYFDVPRYQTHAERAFPTCAYGSLSNRDYREMAAGTRKDVEADKRHPADFALWKAAKPGDHPDASWDSPWGKGRPGWHIECSLMSTRSLGDLIDLHGGGQDLIFPHHENEVAQSQAKTGKAPFVNVWMHTGFLNVEGEKMSKSLGNFIVLTDLLDEMAGKGWGPEVLRFYFLQTHYRSKIDYSSKGLEEAATALERLQRTRRLLAEAAAKPLARGDADLGKAMTQVELDFMAAMDDDLHTPGAIAALFAFQKAANSALDSGRLGAEAARAGLAALERWGGFLTLFSQPIAHGAAEAPHGLLAAARSLGLAASGSERDVMEAILAERATARSRRDWVRSDAIRDALAKAGYAVEDAAGGARWRRP